MFLGFNSTSSVLLMAFVVKLMTPAKAAVAGSDEEGVQDQYDPNWLLYGDRFELTDSSEQRNFHCHCRPETEQKILHVFNTTAVTIKELFNDNQRTRYCELKTAEENCRLNECDLETRWSMTRYVCPKSAQKILQRIVGCLRKSNQLTEKVCHGNCWQQLAKRFSKSSGSTTEFPDLHDAREQSRECYYQLCYLTCQKLILRSNCSPRSLADEAYTFLHGFVGNRTKMESSSASLPAGCAALMQPAITGGGGHVEHVPLSPVGVASDRSSGQGVAAETSANLLTNAAVTFSIPCIWTVLFACAQFQVI